MRLLSCSQHFPSRQHPIDHRRTQHTATRASSQESLITDDRRNSALEFQLKRSSQRQPQDQVVEVPAQSSDAQHDADLAHRRLAARAWITPWLDVRTKGESTKVLREMQRGVSMMDDSRASNAMSRQLNQGRWPSKEEQEAQTESQPQAIPESDSRYAPSETYEDGSMLFSASALGATDASSS